jgi:GNAT superfamily N-acetyltransferase
MPQTIDSYSLRVATTEDLAEAIAIDDAAGLLFVQAGVVVDLPADHPFVVAERARWRHAIGAGQLWFACDGGRPVGFSSLGQAGDLAYLEQLAVRPEHGRRGIGTLLLETACAHSRERGAAELWLTTYAHLAWNAPYYERHGFAVVPESQCNAALRAVLAEQRATLPAPNERVAMRRKLD